MQVKATPIRLKNGTFIQERVQLTTDVLVKHTAADAIESLLNGYTVMWDQSATTELKSLRSQVAEALQQQQASKREDV